MGILDHLGKIDEKLRGFIEECAVRCDEDEGNFCTDCKALGKNVLAKHKLPSGRHYWCEEHYKKAVEGGKTCQ